MALVTTDRDGCGHDYYRKHPVEALDDILERSNPSGQSDNQSSATTGDAHTPPYDDDTT